jgi:hypothetical protein
MVHRVQVRPISNDEGNKPQPQPQDDGDLAKSSEGAAVGTRHGRAADRRGDLHQPRPGAGRAAQLQRPLLRLTGTEVRRRATTGLQPRTAARDQEGRAEPTNRSRAAGLHLEPVEAGRLHGRRGATSRTRACARCCARRASPFQAVKTWKTITDPDCFRPLRGRRPRSGTSTGWSMTWCAPRSVESLCWTSCHGDRCRFVNSLWVRQPGADCRRRRLWKISRWSNIAFSGSRQVRQRCRSGSSTCMRDQQDSMTALS